MNNYTDLIYETQKMIDKMNLDQNRLINNILKETFKSPPCNKCKYFDPQYINDNIFLCINKEVRHHGYHTFECYEKKETPKIVSVNVLPQIDEAKENIIYKCENGLFMFHDGKYKSVSVEHAGNNREG